MPLQLLAKPQVFKMSPKFISLALVFVILACQCNAALFFYHQKTVSIVKMNKNPIFQFLPCLGKSGRFCQRTIGRIEAKDFSLCKTATKNQNSMEKSGICVQVPFQAQVKIE